MEAKKHSRYTKEKKLYWILIQVKWRVSSETWINFNFVVEKERRGETVKMLIEWFSEQLLQQSLETKQQIIKDLTKNIEKTYIDYMYLIFEK